MELFMLKIQQEHLTRLLKKACITDERATMHTAKQWQLCVEAVATVCSTSKSSSFNTQKFYKAIGYEELSQGLWNTNEREDC
jgi:hypothetical protein